MSMWASGWSREWRFFIWTWTINTWDDHSFVEVTQRRFLGQEATHTYGKPLWTLMAAAVMFMGVAGAISVCVLMALILRHSSDPDVLFLAVMGLVCLMLTLASAAVAYFTFVPPREFRSGRKV